MVIEQNVTKFVDDTMELTESRSLEFAHRMEAIGRLTAGIAHEINTPMQFIGDNTRFLSKAFAELQKVLDQLLALQRGGLLKGEAFESMATAIEEVDFAYLLSEIPQAIEQTLEGIERVVKIVEAMRDFSHPGDKEKQAVDLNKCIEKTITLSTNEWKYVARVITDLEPGLPLVPCYQGEINQVILNLIVNAAQAIAQKKQHGSAVQGLIKIRTRRVGDWIELSIADNGCGIPESARSKIFDPFFTTKETGKGTGQGLTMVRTIVTEHHAGTIHFETEVERGTTFTIRLPLLANRNRSGEDPS